MTVHESVQYHSMTPVSAQAKERPSLDLLALMHAFCLPFPSFCGQDQSGNGSQATDVIQQSFLRMFLVTGIPTIVEAL